MIPRYGTLVNYRRGDLRSKLLLEDSGPKRCFMKCKPSRATDNRLSETFTLCEPLLDLQLCWSLVSPNHQRLTIRYLHNQVP